MRARPVVIAALAWPLLAACKSTSAGNGSRVASDASHPLFRLTTSPCGQASARLHVCLGRRGSDHKRFIVLTLADPDAPRKLELPVSKAEANGDWTWYQVNQAPGSWIGMLGQVTLNVGVRGDGGQGKLFVWDQRDQAWHPAPENQGHAFAMTGDADEAPLASRTLNGPSARKLKDLLAAAQAKDETGDASADFVACQRPVLARPNTECTVWRGGRTVTIPPPCAETDSAACAEARTLADAVFEALVNESGAANTGANGQVLTGIATAKAAMPRCAADREACTFRRTP